MTPMSARDLSQPLDASSEVIDFLRRLSSMMAGGRNAEMLLAAANIIEALSGRLAGTEELYHQLREEHSKNLELREVAELASDNLIAEMDALKAQHAARLQHAEQEMDALKAQHAASQQQAEQEMDAVKVQHAVSQQLAEQEIASLKNQLDEHGERAKTDRMAFAEETLRLQATAAEAEARLASANASLEELRNASATIDDSVAVVPVQSLQLARDQFDFLAKGFARSGDVISLTICEIGAQAIEKALADNVTTD
jgi:chromosome segregation ATPase